MMSSTGQAPNTGVKSYSSLEDSPMSSTATMDEGNGGETIFQENPRKRKLEFEISNGKRKREFPLVGEVGTDLQDQHHLTETDTVPGLPSIYSFKRLYSGREAFERFVVKSFQRVNSTDLNERRASCVKVEDFYKHLEDFCNTHGLTVPHRINCSQHLAFMGAKKLYFSNTFVGLRWKESDEDKKNYSFQSKFAEMRKLQTKIQEAEKTRFVPHPKYIINFNVDQEGTTRVWKSTDLCFYEHEEVEPEVMNVKLYMLAKFRIGSFLDLNQVAKKLNNVETLGKPPKAIRIQLRKPAVTALLYNSGKATVTGSLDRDTLKNAARRIARLVQKASMVPVTFSSFQISDVTACHHFPCCVSEESRIMLMKHLSYDLDENGTTHLAKPNFMCNTVHLKNSHHEGFASIHFKMTGFVRIVASSPRIFVGTFKKFSKVLMQFYGRNRTQYEEDLNNEYIKPPSFVDI